MNGTRERFQDKWTRLSASRTRPDKDLEPGFGSTKTQQALERFQDKWTRLSASRTRPDKDLEPGFGSTKTQQALKNLLVATASGLIIVAAAAFAIVPAKAAGYNIGAPGKVVDIAWWDQLNVRQWPAFYTKESNL